MKGKILHKKVLSNKWAEYAEYKVEYTRSDGKVEIQTREIHDSGNGAAILLYNKKKKTVILIKQFRLPALIQNVDEGVIIEVCAGLVENEDPTYTIIKEVKEEIGMTIENPKYLYDAFATPGAKTEIISFFSCEYNASFEVQKYGGLSSEQEDIEVVEIDFDLAFSWISQGIIKDAKTIILLYHARASIFT